MSYIYDVATADDTNEAAAMGFYDMILPWTSVADKMNSILYSFLTWGGNKPSAGALTDIPDASGLGHFSDDPQNSDGLQEFAETK